MTNDVINYVPANLREVVISRDGNHDTLADKWDALCDGRIDLQLSIYGDQVSISLYDLYTTGKITEDCYHEIISDYLAHEYDDWDGDLCTMHTINF